MGRLNFIYQYLLTCVLLAVIYTDDKLISKNRICHKQNIYFVHYVIMWCDGCMSKKSHIMQLHTSYEVFRTDSEVSQVLIGEVLVEFYKPLMPSLCAQFLS